MNKCKHLLFTFLFTCLFTSLFYTCAFAQLSSCANADFEQNSFVNWTGTTGTCCPINSTVPGIVPGRHTIMSGPGTDPNTNGAITVVAPGGQYSARLGNDSVGAEAEQLSYQISVDPSNALFIYRYAVVFENPPHLAEEQPRFEIRVFDQNGDSVGCGTYNVYATSGIPGFVTYNDTLGRTILYKDWTTVGIDLSPYIGQTVTIEFSTGDCSLGGHFGYAYVDCYCSPLQILSDFCTGASSTTLTAPIGFLAYAWSNGDTTQSISIPNATVGAQYQCTMTSVTGCTMTLTAIISPTIMASAYGQTGLCQNGVQFFDSSVVVTGSPINNWIWSFGDGSTSTLQNPTHTYNTPGNYNVSLVVSNYGGCSDTVQQQITIKAAPVAVFTNTSACPGDTVYFTESSYDPAGTISNWKWDFGDGSIVDTTRNPKHVFVNPGNYVVSLIVTSSNGCNDTTTHTFTTNPVPIPIFTPPSGCPMTPLQCINTSSISSGVIWKYEWNFHDGSPINTSIHPIHSFVNSGNQLVTLTAISTLGCKDSITNTITILPAPNNLFTSTIVCKVDTTQFTNLSQPNSNSFTFYSWNYGDGSPTQSGIANPIHHYNNSGTYIATLITKNDFGCADTLKDTVRIKENPIPDFNFTGPFCIDQPITFSNNSTLIGGSISTSQWYDSNGNLSTISNPSFSYTTPNNYLVHLTVVGSNGCKDSIAKNLTINNIPFPTFSYNNVCLNKETTFAENTTGSTITKWNWNFGDGTSDTLKVVKHLYQAAGNYNVTLFTEDQNGCIGDTAQIATVHSLPSANFSANDPCIYDSLQVSNLSTIINGYQIQNYEWNFGDNSTTETSFEPKHSYKNSNYYSISLTTLSNTGCMDTLTKTIFVHPLPVVNFATDTVCKGVPTNFVNLATIDTGSLQQSHWNYGDNTTNTTASMATVSHIYLNAGNHNATMTVTSNHGCIDSLSKQVLVRELPIANLSANIVQGCIPLNIKFTDQSIATDGAINHWNWDFGNGDQLNYQHPDENYCIAGNYDVQLEVSSIYGCKDDTVYHNYIHAFAIPTANFEYNPNDPGVYMPELHFYDQSLLATKWWWNFGDSTIATEENPSHIYNASGLYKIELIVESKDGCRDTTWELIDLKNDYAIWIPNAFSPNNDFKNETFYVKGFGFTDYKMAIFNRWGDEIFRSTDVEKGWNGLYNDKPVAEGVYVYKVDVKDIFGNPHTYTGRVSIVR